MAITIDYRATRNTPLSPAEAADVATIVRRYSVDQRLHEYLTTGNGLNWESFDLNIGGEALLSGATKLPDNTDEATWTGLQHWCECLGELRRLLPGCIWQVRVEDHELVWDEAAQAYDPGL